MRIADRYILRRHAGPFAFGTGVVMFLFLMQFLVRYGEQLLGKELPIGIILQLIGLNLAWMFVLAVPMGALFASVYVFGMLAADHEATALKSAGVSAAQMMRSVLLAALGLTGMLAWFNDRVLPEANHQAKVLLADVQRKRPTLVLEPGRFVQLEGYTVLARAKHGAMLLAVTLYDVARSDRIAVVYADTAWLRLSTGMSRFLLELRSGELHEQERANWYRYRRARFERMWVQIPAHDYAFVRSDARLFARGEREMSIAQMRQIVEHARARQRELLQQMEELLQTHLEHVAGGIDSGGIAQWVTPVRFRLESLSAEYAEAERQARQHLVEIHKKYAIAAACVLFVLAGAPLGLLTRGGNFGTSALVSLGFYVFYWAALIGGEKLADRGYISPAVGMWWGNAVVALLALSVFVRVQQETRSWSRFRR